MASAVLHAYWNLLVKRARDRPVFMWLSMVASIVLYLPVYLWVVWREGAAVSNLLFPLVGGAIQGVYCYLLPRTYDIGDLSLTYPLARGAAPVFIGMIAPMLLGERLSAPGYLGMGVVFVGVWVLHADGLSLAGLWRPARALRERASLFALATSLTIAAYHLIDKAGIAGSHPVAYIYLMHFPMCLVLAALLRADRRSKAVAAEWHDNKVGILAVGFLCLGAYLLVLTAMKLWAVSYVASVRNLSIVFGVLLGARVLGERHLAPRLLGAALIVTGIATLALYG